MKIILLPYRLRRSFPFFPCSFYLGLNENNFAFIRNKEKAEVPERTVEEKKRVAR